MKHIYAIWVSVVALLQRVNIGDACELFIFDFMHVCIDLGY